MHAAHSLGCVGRPAAAHAHRRAAAACCQRSPAAVLRVPASSQLPRAQESFKCRYTSVKDRLGEPNDELPHKHDKEDGESAQQSEGGPESTQAPGTATNTSWRKRDAAGQRAATALLDAIHSDAVAANPDQAGHPEQHRALRTDDYSADQPAGIHGGGEITESGDEGQQAEGGGAK